MSAGVRRWTRQETASVVREADRLEQDNACINGTEGCPGPDSGSSALPCSACFFDGEGGA